MQALPAYRSRNPTDLTLRGHPPLLMSKREKHVTGHQRDVAVAVTDGQAAPGHTVINIKPTTFCPMNMQPRLKPFT